VIMAGAILPGQSLDSGGPPLLALQGTADTVNPPAATDGFFAALERPKFLVALIDGTHTAPFSRRQPQLKVVEQATLAFLDRYLKGQVAASARLSSAANVTGVAQLTSDP
jgi:fermentation-respiration switch protein FrsA (DUF1100 family)